MKAVLQLKHGFMPPLPHFRRLNLEIQKEMGKEFGGKEAEWPVKVAVKGENLERNIRIGGGEKGVKNGID